MYEYSSSLNLQWDHTLDQTIKSAAEKLQEEFQNTFQQDNLYSFIKSAKANFLEQTNPFELEKEKISLSTYELLGQSSQNLQCGINYVIEQIKNNQFRMGEMGAKKQRLNLEVENLNKQQYNESKKLASEVTTELKRLQSNMESANKGFLQRLYATLDTLDTEETNLLRESLPNMNM